jgi:enoyl-CoA hydratase
MDLDVGVLETLAVDVENEIATITLDRPDRRNAIDPTMIAEFDRVFDALDARPDLKVVVLKGNGPSFCAGYDMKAHYGGVGTERSEKKRPQYEDLQWNKQTVARWTRLWDMPKVTIAQVHGYCLAGALMLAMHCDLVYVAEDALIGQPHSRKMAMTPEFAFWPLTIGFRHTKELLYTGDLVTGVDAAELGMVNRALPADELDDFVRWMARRISLMSHGMLQTHKHAVNEVADAVGYRQMLSAGIHADTVQHYLDENYEFRDQVQRSTGVKEAVADRDRQHGGMVTQRLAWERERARLVAERASD